MNVQNKYGVQVGDVYYCSWGYDETHVNYYEVVRVTASKAEVVPLACVREASGTQDVVVPVKGSVAEWDVLIRVNREDEKKSKLCSITRGYQGRPSIVLQGGRHWAWPWDGKPQYTTNPMFGR